MAQASRRKATIKTRWERRTLLQRIEAARGAALPRARWPRRASPDPITQEVTTADLTQNPKMKQSTDYSDYTDSMSRS
jgi:hypothetical protein